MKDLLNAYKRQVSGDLGINFIDFKQSSIQNKYFYKPAADSAMGNCSSNSFNNLEISIRDENEVALKSMIIEPSCVYYKKYPISIWWAPTIPRYSYWFNSDSNDRYKPEFSLLNSGGARNGIVDRVIFTKKEYFLIMEIDLDLLTKINEIEFSFLEN